MNPSASSVNTTTDSDDPLNGDPELRKVLAEMFVEDCPKLLEQIRAAMLQRDGEALRLAAHTLKGSAGVFKVQPAYDAALHVEHIGRDCDWDNCENAWGVLVKEMAGLSASLSDLLK